jgi:hypothetical protein
LGNFELGHGNRYLEIVCKFAVRRRLLKRKEPIHFFKESVECESQETAVYEAVPVSEPVAYRLFVSQIAY